MTNFSEALSNDPMLVVEAFRVAMIAGDAEGLADAHVEGDVAIVDKVAPFIWKGPTAVADWMLSMTLYFEERDISDGSIVYHPPSPNWWMATKPTPSFLLSGLTSRRTSQYATRPQSPLRCAARQRAGRLPGGAGIGAISGGSVPNLAPFETYRDGVGLYS